MTVMDASAHSRSACTRCTRLTRSPARIRAGRGMPVDDCSFSEMQVAAGKGVFGAGRVSFIEQRKGSRIWPLQGLAARSDLTVRTPRPDISGRSAAPRQRSCRLTHRNASLTCDFSSGGRGINGAIALGVRLIVPSGPESPPSQVAVIFCTDQSATLMTISPRTKTVPPVRSWRPA